MIDVFSADAVETVRAKLTEMTEGGKTVTRKVLAESLGMEASEPTSPGMRTIDALIANGKLHGFISMRGRTGGLARPEVLDRVAADKASKAEQNANMRKGSKRKHLQMYQ